MAFNSGLFFVKANDKTIDLMTRIAGGWASPVVLAWGRVGGELWVGGAPACEAGWEAVHSPGTASWRLRVCCHPPTPCPPPADKLSKQKEWDQSVWNE